MNQELPYVMHPRYNEYLVFLEGCPHRQSAASLEFGFWVYLELSWLKNNFSMDSLEKIIAKSNERLEENERLIEENNALKQALSEVNDG